MSRNYYFTDQDKPYFITLGVVNWIDIFTRSAYKEIMVENINYCIKNKGMIVYAWVIMTNHLHLIVGTKREKLQYILRDLKKYTAKEIIKEIKVNMNESRKNWMLELFEKAGHNNSNNENYQFWQQHNHPIILEDNKIIDQKLNYLHNNPVSAGIVLNSYEYKYSSATDYAGGKGLINIEIIR